MDDSDTVFRSLDAIKESLRQIEHDFSEAMDWAEKASLLLQLKRFGPVPPELKESDTQARHHKPTKDNARDQLHLLFDLLHSQQGYIESVRDIIDEATWLIANGRIESSGG